jgi:hypothetical protein
MINRIFRYENQQLTDMHRKTGLVVMGYFGLNPM